MANRKSSSGKRGRDDSDIEDENDSAGEGEAELRQDRPAGWLERAATILSALLVAGMLGVLIYDATRPSSPPAFETKLGRIDTIGGNLRIPVEVRNTGDEAGHNVQLHIEILSGDSVLAESDLQVDWLAGRSKHDAVGFFEKPTLPYTAKAEVRGYTEP